MTIKDMAVKELYERRQKTKTPAGDLCWGKELIKREKPEASLFEINRVPPAEYAEKVRQSGIIDHWQPHGMVEWHMCCAHVKINHYKSLEHHCRTSKHVAALFGIPENELRGNKYKANLLILKAKGEI